MAGIWINSGTDETRWTLGAPRPFPDEKTLHGLIAENPQLLPLTGSPQLTILGSEVQLGAGYADILAVEPSGRPAIIEVKLAYNQEARSAIVSQTLYYAAFLQGLTVENLEQNFAVRDHLETAGHKSILEAVQANGQDGIVDADSFTNSLQGFLDRGEFRLVLVLDGVPDELARIVSYLDAMTIQALTIDLITVSVYDVNDTQVVLPQRVVLALNAEKTRAESGGSKPTKESQAVQSEGSQAFRDAIANTSGEDRKTFDKLIAWAEEVADLPGVRLGSTVGVTRTTLWPILSTEGGLVTISTYDNNQKPVIYGYRSVFERRAPNSLDDIERNFPDINIGAGTIIPISDEILDALTAAYREATGAPPLSPPQEPPA